MQSWPLTEAEPHPDPISSSMSAGGVLRPAWHNFTATHKEGLTCDPAGLFGSEEHDHLRNVLRQSSYPKSFDNN